MGNIRTGAADYIDIAGLANTHILVGIPITIKVYPLTYLSIHVQAFTLIGNAARLRGATGFVSFELTYCLADFESIEFFHNL